MRSEWSVQVRTFLVRVRPKGGGTRGHAASASARDIFREEENMAVAEESWTKKYLGEVLGVFVLVFLGEGSRLHRRPGRRGVPGGGRRVFRLERAHLQLRTHGEAGDRAGRREWHRERAHLLSQLAAPTVDRP